MKVSIWSDGDRSVGINGFSATVDIGDYEDLDEENRQYMREKLSECFGELWDETAHVMFDDEIDDEFDYDAKDY